MPPIRKALNLIYQSRKNCRCSYLLLSISDYPYETRAPFLLGNQFQTLVEALHIFIIIKIGSNIRKSHLLNVTPTVVMGSRVRSICTWNRDDLAASSSKLSSNCYRKHVTWKNGIYLTEAQKYFCSSARILSLRYHFPSKQLYQKRSPSGQKIR